MQTSEKQVLTTEYFEKVVREAYDSGMIRPIINLAYYYLRTDKPPCGCAIGAFYLKEFGGKPITVCDKIKNKYIISQNDLYDLMDGFDGRPTDNKDNEWYQLGQKLHSIYIK
jgi:hypothetical protein